MDTQDHKEQMDTQDQQGLLDTQAQPEQMDPMVLQVILDLQANRAMPVWVIGRFAMTPYITWLVEKSTTVTPHTMPLLD